MYNAGKGLFFERQAGEVIITKTDDNNLPATDRSNVVFAQKLSIVVMAGVIAHLSMGASPEQSVLNSSSFTLSGSIALNAGTDIQTSADMRPMWTHYCDDECSMLSVGKGEECNWCGCTEEQQRNTIPPTWAAATRDTVYIPEGVYSVNLDADVPEVYAVAYSCPISEAGHFGEPCLNPVITPIITPVGGFDPN